ncbi:hypothetical protein Tco_1467877 [Tanacetum coccineum]
MICQQVYVFLGERNGLSVSTVRVTRLGFRRNIVECKESRIGKQPIEVPSNMVITLEGQDMKVKERLVLVGDVVVLKDPEQSDNYQVRRLAAIYSGIEGARSSSLGLTDEAKLRSKGVNNLKSKSGSYYRRSILHLDLAKTKTIPGEIASATGLALDDPWAPHSLWGEACLAANTILNKIPHKKSDKSPYQLWKGKQPSYKRMKVWGCLAKDKEKQISNLRKRVMNDQLSQDETNNNYEVPQENVEPRRNDSSKSSKQTVNTRSTMEAEFVALDKAAEEAEWLRSFLEGLNHVHQNNAPQSSRNSILKDPHKHALWARSSSLGLTDEAKLRSKGVNNLKSKSGCYRKDESNAPFAASSRGKFSLLQLQRFQFEEYRKKARESKQHRSQNDLVSPRRGTGNPLTRIPLEPAPWKQEVSSKSVYGQIEKRLNIST